MIKRNLHDLDSIFLDSGILIDLLKIDMSGSDASTISRVESVKLFFDCLKNPLAAGKKRKRYLISSISLAEIFHVDGYHQKTVDAINSVINSQEVELHAFDEYTAMYHNKEFAKELGNKEIAKMKVDINYPTGGNYSNISGRIRKDIMIASTAKMNNVDITLTTDKGFKSLCDRLGINCYWFNEDKNRFVYDSTKTIIYSLG